MLDNADLTEAEAGAAMQRATGTGRATFRVRDGKTVLDDLYQSGAAKIRLPKHAAMAGREAVLINTAGGLTGGDRLQFEIGAGADTQVVATTQASEKVYRAASGVARIETRLTLAPDAALAWLPQDTILFNTSALDRRLTVDMAGTASLIALESTVFGRMAMNETLISGRFRESWRIRRDGGLVFSDETRLDGAIAETLNHRAVAKGAGAMATLVMVAPAVEARIEAVRAVLPDAAGASAWNGMLVARMLAPDGQSLRQSLTTVLSVLREGAPLPKVWSC